MLNRRDDDGDGYVDEQFDGVDNDGDGITDPGYDGVDNDGDGVVDEPAELLISLATDGRDNDGDGAVDEADEPDEYEDETADIDRALFDGSTARVYSIGRRPMVAPDAREVALPASAVIDLSTSVYYIAPPSAFLKAESERSRVPIDPSNGYVDLVIDQNGRVTPSSPWGPYSATSMAFPFYYLWIADRGDVVEPLITVAGQPFLPVPRDAAPAATRVLEGNRRMVVLSPNSGHASVSEITDFGSVNAPFAQARANHTGR